MKRMLRSPAILIAAVLFFAVAATGDCSANDPAEDASSIQIHLDYNPFTEPLSMTLSLKDGAFSAVSYNRETLSVSAVNKGTLTKAETDRLIDKSRHRGLSEAFQRKTYKSGPAQGDQFYFSLKSPALSGECAGFVEDAPKDLQDLIRDLRESSKRLGKASVSEAYINGSPIEKERFDLLLREKTLRITPISEFPLELQTILMKSIKGPREFHPLSRAQYSLLMKWTSHGNTVYVNDNGRGHQTALYLSQGRSSH